MAKLVLIDPTKNNKPRLVALDKGEQTSALPAPQQNNMAAPAAAGITGAVAGAIPQVQLPPPTQQSAPAGVPAQTNAQSYYNDTLRSSLQQQIEAKTKERDQYDPSSRQWRKANRQLGALYGQQAQAASQAAMPGSTPVLGSLLTPDSDVDVQRKKVSALYREASTLSDDHTPEGQKAYMEKLAEAEEANRVLHDMGGRYGLAEGAVTTAENLGAGVAGAVRGIGNALGYVGQLQARTAMMQADPYLRMWGQDEVADANAADIQRARDNGLQSAAEMLESVGVSGAGKVDQLIQNFQQTAAEHAQASGKVTQAIANTANGVGGMVPSILSNIAVPGSGLWVMAGQAFGNATEEAIKAGATDEKAVLYGGAVAAVEVLTEKMFGGIPGLNVGSLDDAIENAVKKSVGTAAEQRAIMFFVDALGEGAEEFVSEFADWGLNKWLVGSDERSFRDVNKDAWYSALIGALTSVAMSTPVEVIKAMGPKGLAERVAQEVEFRVGKHEDAIASYQEAAEKYGLMSPEAVQAQQRARETGLQARQAKADLQRTLGADPEQVRQASQLLGRAQTADATYDLGGTGTETTNAGIMLPTAQENYTLPTLASEQNRGIMSAEENAQEEVFDGREQSPGREGRQGSLAPAEQGGELGTRTEGTEVREPGYAEESGRDSGQAGEALRTVSEYKSGADLGIETAVSAAEDKTKTLREVVKYNDAEQKIIDYGKAHGQDVHFYTGDLWVKGKNGKQYKVRGLISGDGKTVWIKSDHAVLSATQIYKHENYHAAIKANPAIREDGINRIKNKYKRNENGLRQLIKTYAELYAMSDEQVSDDYILEEILCDAHAGIDVLTTTKRGGLKTVDLSKEANKALETGKKSAAESSQAKASRGHWKPKFDQTEWSIANSLVNNYSGQDINETTKYAFASKKGKSVFVIYSTERADDKTLLYGVSGKDASVALSYMQEVFDGATEEVDRIRDAVSAYIARTKNKPNGRNSDSPKFRNGGTENGNAVLSERGVGEQTVSGVDSGQSNRDNGELKALKNTLANGRTFYSRDVTEEKAPRQYNIPEGFAAYIRNTSAKFVDKILNGQKTVETRNDRTLDSYIGKWMPILKTETGEVVGEVHIKGVKEYESVQDFRDDFAAHQVPKNSKFDWDGTGHKYGYIIDGVRKFDQPVQPAGEKYGRIAKGIEKAVENSEPIRADSEALASREFDDDYMANAEKANEKNKYADAKAMKQARKDRKRIHDYMEKIADMLPPDITGDTFYSDSSYGGSEENTTICPRTLAYEEFLDAVAEELGRPLTVEDTTFICQEAMAMTDKPECLYCYVAMDRKAYREYLGNYIEQRDAFLKDIRDGMEPGLVKPVKKSEANGNRTIPKDTAYGKFLNGRANTVNMYNRAKLWMETENLITKKDLASIASMNKAAQDPALRAQIDDAQSYAQSASWAKKKNGFAAYNNHILKWSKAKVDKLNKHYGLRMYSFSDYSPAFILENMQQITDAAVKGLKVLGYTKELDFVRIFAPTGMNINISVFGYNDWSSGQVAMDAMQGADWTQAQELRAKYPNVGCTFVATNDAQVEWALAQDWIDVVIPFHIVRTGANVASMFGWKNYTDMSADKKNPNWKKGNKKSIYPSEHQNDKDLYLELCQENNLTPRFEKWVDNPNYMKLVNETRQSDAETKPVQPVFDMTVAEASLDEMVKRGGYVQHIGGTSENMRTLASETAEKLAGKTKEEVRSAVEDRARYSLDMVEPVQPKSDEWERGATTDEVRAAHPTLYAVDEDATEERNPTQVKGTIGTYRKLYKILESEGFNGTILDASSGLGYGTEAGRSEFGFDVDDIEPYPGADYTPKYTDYSKLKKKYDVVISNAVLNVLPQDQRDALVVKMGELLSDGGRMFVNVRGKDVLNASGKIPINEGQMEYFIPRTAKTGSYQKGFTADELKAYLEDALGDGFSVEKTNKFGAVSAVVTKSSTDEAGVAKASRETAGVDHVTDTEYLAAAESGDEETAGRLVDEAAEKAMPDSKVRNKKTGKLRAVYHYTNTQFTEFRPMEKSVGSNRTLGDGYYVSTDPNEFKSFGRFQMAMFANITNPFEMEMTEAQAQAVYDKYFRPYHEDRFHTYEPHVLSKLQSYSQVFDYLKEAAEKNNTTTSAILSELGYDGVHSGIEWVAFDSSQLKSADPVTYDDSGKIIPLRDRFNPEKPDIRYSRDANDDYNAVVRENKRLKKQVEYWQGQTKATEGWKADAKQEAKVTKDILKSTSSKADADEMTKRITRLHEDLSNGKLTYEQGKEVATQIASDIISKSERLVGKDVETYREARKIIKSTPQTHAAYNQLQALMGNELFPDVLGDEARKEIIDDVMGAMKPFVDNPYDLQKAIVIESVADDIVNAGMEMRQAKPTIVDVERAKTAEAKAEGARALEEQRLVDRMFYERRIAEIRRQHDEKIEAVKQHQRDVNEHRREMREEANDRRRLLKLVKRLQGKTVDPVTKAQLPEILKTLDTVSVNITDKSIQNLTELRQWYHDKTTQGSDVYDPNFIPDKATLAKLDRLEKVMNGGSIGDMSIMQVRELTEVLLNIEHNMLEARKFQKSKLAIDNYEAGMRLIQDIDNAVPGGINRELSPLRAARRIAGYNDGAIEGTEASPVITLMQECIAGERAAQMYTREATHMLSKYLNDKAFMRGLYGRRAQEITITGYDARTGEKKSVAITPAMRVSLYLHSLNDDNMRHVQEGGVLIPDMRLYKKGNLAEAYAADNRLKLTKQNVASICANMTEQERGFARALWRYFNEYAPKSLNEASVELDGYEKFNVENYFPISVDSNFLGQDYQQMVMESDGSLTHPGFGEERIQSSKPIYLRDVNDVFRTAVEQNAAYACKAVPLSNLNKLINVQQVGAVDSVSAALDRRFTAKKKSPVTVSGADYLAKFMRDYAGNRGGKKSGIDKMLAKIRSNYSGAVLTLAAGTAIKQAASYPTAAAVVSTKSLTQALNLARTVDTSFIDKYTATFTQRKEGFSSVEQAELSQEGRHIPKVLNWIQAVDVATTWALKRAAAIEVQHTTNLKPGTREYEQAVVDMYQRIIEETQPNYSTALRPDILRSDSALERALVMFATQPMQNFGILYDAVNDFSAKRRAYMNTESASAKKAYQAAAKKLGRAIGSQLASSLVFALMQAAYDWFRKKDDKYKDDGEWTWESFAKGIGLNMLTNGAGLFIGGKVALEFMEVFADKISGQKIFGTQAYGFDVAELEAITDAVKSSVNAVGTVSSAVRSAAAGESVDYEGLARKIWTATEDALKLAGVPLENATTMVTSVAKKVMRASMGPYIGDYYALRVGADPASSKAAFYDNLYQAWKKAPNSTMRELYDIMLQDGFTPDGVKSAMESRAKNDEGVGSVKELKKRWPLK